MELNNTAWLFVADAQKGRLLECGVAPLNRCHVEQRAAVKSAWEGHEHHRPSPLAGKSGHSYASPGHEHEEDLHRFAKQVARWLGQQTAARGIARLLVLAPPRFLGSLRKTVSHHLEVRLELKQGDFTRLTTHQLSQHPVVRGLVGLS